MRRLKKQEHRSTMYVPVKGYHQNNAHLSTVNTKC